MSKRRTLNQELREFISDLDNASHINVTDWEAEFIESCLNQPHDHKFSISQVEVINELRLKYEGTL